MTDPASLAGLLDAARRERRTITPFTDDDPEFDEAFAYDVQWAGVTARLDAGERLAGAKLGLTSRAKQRAMGVDAPLHGWVTSGMLLPYGEPLDRGRFVHPRAEPEIAFRLARDVQTPATVTGVLAATEVVFAAIDVLDSRYAGYRFRLPDVIADNASAGAFLLGPAAVPPTRIEDLRLLGCVLRAGGEVVATAAGAAVMGHPAAAVAWLANRLAARGRTLSAGMLVFSGGLTEPVPLHPGAAVTAEFEQLGTVEVTAAA